MRDGRSQEAQKASLELELEIGARRAPRLLVFKNSDAKKKTKNVALRYIEMRRAIYINNSSQQSIGCSLLSRDHL